jgi:hypothetical protein
VLYFSNDFSLNGFDYRISTNNVVILDSPARINVETNLWYLITMENFVIHWFNMKVTSYSRIIHLLRSIQWLLFLLCNFKEANMNIILELWNDIRRYGMFQLIQWFHSDQCIMKWDWNQLRHFHGHWKE